MKLGLFGINFGPCADPEVAVRVAQSAEQAGLESLWTGEHVVLPEPQAPPSPSPPETPFLDPAVALAFVAGATRTIRLGTGIIILPQRNPLILAKELASVDVLSGGRLLFGVGAGYLHQEFAALGVSFENKGARTVEYLAAILELWTQPQPRFHGKFVEFAGIQAFPRPLQRPHPPIHMGGSTAPAFRRAVELCQGWYGFALDLEATRSALDALQAQLGRGRRPPHLGELEISITPRGRLDRDLLRRYEDLGVHRLIVYRPTGEADELLRTIEATAALAG